ncbi:MAG TPA: sigma 54-interacting transcriptional regulator, partial [Myxococcota bacterium]|nr:sigma 54-interacting transcriptional regulator [Myxococcota bacterium]
FLDEIGDAPAAVQVKLLRVLQERSYMPVGATEAVSTNARVLAATNRDLRADITGGRFREDLFYRLHVIPITMPALRERREDIPLLAELFLSRTSAQHGHAAPHLTSEALHVLMQHDWPGNVRELANAVQGAALLSADGVLRPHHLLAVLPRVDGAQPAPEPRQEVGNVVAMVGERPNVLAPLREAREAFDRAYLQEALRLSGGNVSAAAKLSGRNRTDFHDLLRRYEINAADFR